MNENVVHGLEGVIATESRVGYIDGEKGELFYAGYDIHDLAEHATFEEVVHLLWHGRLPTALELDTLCAQLSAESQIPDEILDLLRRMPAGVHPMTALRTAISALAAHDPDGEAGDRDANLRKAIRLQAKAGPLVAAFDRIRNGHDPIAAPPGLSLAEGFLFALRGEKPHPTEARAFDLCLVLHADHGLNASTFTARVIAATLSDMYSAVTGAVGALKGPLHGGANTAVMEMLEEIGSEDRVDAFIDAALSSKRRIMGFGHRVYRTFDPRAVHLRRLSRELGEVAGDGKWYRMSEKILEGVKAKKGLDPNVDFFSASTYHVLGIARDLFTPIFAVSRMSGWTAHILEQLENNRLIRPRLRYVGETGRRWTPQTERS
jgi:citrate synthase